jgi:hypothetical protein
MCYMWGEGAGGRRRTECVGLLAQAFKYILRSLLLPIFVIRILVPSLITRRRRWWRYGGLHVHRNQQRRPTTPQSQLQRPRRVSGLEQVSVGVSRGHDPIRGGVRGGADNGPYIQNRGQEFKVIIRVSVTSHEMFKTKPEMRQA